MIDDANDLRGRLDAAHILIAQQIAAIAELAAQNANLLHQIMQQQAKPEPPPCDRHYERGQLHPRFPSGDCVECGALCTERCKHENYQAWEKDQTS